MPIEITDEQVFLAEPDGKLIPDIQGQHKCDFLIYCQNQPQSCFIELKGENMSIEKHVFIVSPGRQKLPKGIESKERFLWQKLVQKGETKAPVKIPFVK